MLSVGLHTYLYTRMLHIQEQYKRKQLSKINKNSWVWNFVVYLLTGVCGIALPDSYY